MQQKNKIACPKHPKNPLNMYVNINPAFKNPRFHCATCFFEAMKDGSNLNDFLPFSMFIDDFNSFLMYDGQKNSLYSKHIYIYNPLFEDDIEEVLLQLDQLINQASNEVCSQLEQLKVSLKDQISLHRQLKQKLNEAQQSWSKVVGYTKFQEEYAQIQQLEKDSNSQEWKNLEASLENIIKYSQIEQNDEFQVISSSLDQIYQQLSNLQAKGLPQFPTTLQNVENRLKSSILNCLSINILSTSLCSQIFLKEIFKKINKKVDNSQLLYKLGQDAKDHSLVWQRINGKSNTLMFIKFETNEIIGAYTPAVWNSLAQNYVTDNSSMSFLFSVTKQQIYPLSQNPGYAIYCWSDYLPTFGSGHDLHLTKDFTLGYSKIGHTYQINQYNPVIQGQLSSHNSQGQFHQFQQNDLLQIILLLICYIISFIIEIDMNWLRATKSVI